MFTRTGAYVADQCRAQHLNSQQLAALLGYTNLVKGARRVLALERNGEAVDELLDKIVDALALDSQYVQALVAEDRRQSQEDWQCWVNEAVEPQLRRLLIPAIWGRAEMPKALSREEATEFAKTRAVEGRLTYVLVWSRKEEVWCYPSGETCVRMNVGEEAGPFTRLRGRGNRGFIFG